MKRRRASADALDTGATLGGQEPSVLKTTRLLQADPDTPGNEDRRFVERLRQDASLLARAVDPAQRLAGLLRRPSTGSLEGWLNAAGTTPQACLAAGLRRDVEAVRSAVATRWSTSPVEGQIGRLKMLKRTMDGRMGFTPLRQRLVAAT